MRTFLHRLLACVRQAATLAAALFLVNAAEAGDSSSSRYAVVSALGDSLQVVHEEWTVGSNIDPNRVRKVEATEWEFDRQALLDAREAILQHAPGAKVSLMSVSPNGTPEASHGFVEGERFTPPDDLRAELTKDQVRYLILLTKLRGDALFKTSDGYGLGQGKIEGLGIYVNSSREITEIVDGQRQPAGTGYLAPFAYVQLSMIDVPSGRVLRRTPMHESTMIGAGRAASGHPWDALTDNQKVQALHGVLGRGLETSLPPLLDGL